MHPTANGGCAQFEEKALLRYFNDQARLRYTMELVNRTITRRVSFRGQDDSYAGLQMRYDKLRSELATVDEHLSKLRIKLAPDAEVVIQIELVREFLRDLNELTDTDVLTKWNPRFRAFYDAQIAVARLCAAINEMLSKQQAQLSKYLRIILGGAITQGGTPQQARDFFYELWLASVFSEAGFKVALQEPDIVVDRNGLSQKIGIACKYPSSEQQIHPNLSKGYSQLTKQGLRGFVALGIDQIVIEQAGLRSYLDFNQGGKHPLTVLQDQAESVVHKIVLERATRFPSEVPVDGLLVTLSLGGIYGAPPQFTVVTALAMHCTDTSLIMSDIARLYGMLNAIQVQSQERPK